MRRLLASGLNAWFVLNLLGSLVVLRWVAEIDDGEGRRAPQTHANGRADTVGTPR